MGTIWQQPSPSDFDRWQQMVNDGADPSTAAQELGFGGSSTFRRNDPARHAEVLDLWRDRTQARARSTALATLLEIAEQGDQEPSRVSAANTLAKIGGLVSDRVEVTGAEGGPVEFAVREARDQLASRLDDIAERRATALAPPESE